MNILRKKIIILLLLVLINGRAFAANQANQTLSMGLPEVLEIEKIIVEDIEHEKMLI